MNPAAAMFIPTPVNPYEGLPALLTIEQVAKLTGYTTRYLNRLCSDGLMPKKIHPAGGRTTRFKLVDIVTWIESGCEAPTPTST